MNDATHFISFFKSSVKIILEDISSIISVVAFEDEPELGDQCGLCGCCTWWDLECACGEL